MPENMEYAQRLAQAMRHRASGAPQGMALGQRGIQGVAGPQRGEFIRALLERLRSMVQGPGPDVQAMPVGQPLPAYGGTSLEEIQAALSGLGGAERPQRSFMPMPDEQQYAPQRSFMPMPMPQAPTAPQRQMLPIAAPKRRRGQRTLLGR